MSTRAAISVAAVLQHTYSWTQAAATVTPVVAQQVAPTLTIAAQLYEAGQYPAAMDQVSRAVSMLHQARQAYPALPELLPASPSRGKGQGGRGVGQARAAPACHPIHAPREPSQPVHQ